MRFGEIDGTGIEEIRLRNAAGAEASVLTWGATLRDLRVPAGAGLRRVVLGYRDLDGYRVNPCYLGATAGRFANRIKAGRFTLDGKAYDVPRNEGGRTHLHGGEAGFSRRAWDIVEAGTASVLLRLVSEDGDQGYPGRVIVDCRYTLDEPGVLRVEMSAVADSPTIVSLAHHSYFTLGGDVRDHSLELFAPFYTPVDGDKIPTGEVLSVAGTPYDFTGGRRIGSGGVSYDTNFLLGGDGSLRPAARLTAPDRSLTMDVRTTTPAVQFYDGHMLSACAEPLVGQVHAPFAGLCLEPQHVPDAPNQHHFPSARLGAGQVYSQVTEYAFNDIEQ